MEIENQKQVSLVAKAFEDMVNGEGIIYEMRMCQKENSPVLALVTLNMWPLKIRGFRLMTKVCQHSKRGVLNLGSKNTCSPSKIRT